MGPGEWTPIDGLEHWAAARPGDVYLRQPRGGVYHDFTWGDVRQQALQLAVALRRLDLTRGDRIALLAKNCAEWFITDLALMLGGYVSVPIYPTAHADTIRHALLQSEAKAIFVGKLDSWPSQQAAVGDEILRLALPYDTMPARYDWQQLLELGGRPADLPRPDPDAVATIVYTSGSTGRPRGAVHTFRGIGWAGRAIARDFGGTTGDRVVSYLPLAHITERVFIEITSLCTGGVVGFVESRETFLDDVKRARPTMFISVPRLWSLFRLGVLDKIGEKKLDLLLRIPLLRDLVKRAIRSRLGLADARTLGSGSAKAPPQLIEWYRRVGLEITEGWGMTENCAYGTVNFPFDASKIGSAGRAGLDCELRVSDDGELLFRSPGVMKEYYKDPEATAAAFTEDGFFRTGDLCRIDEDGYVFFTGRAKDNFKTAKGKFVAPVHIELELARDRNIETSCVIGAGLPQPVALVQIASEAKSTPREQLRGALQATLAAVNAKLEPHEKLDAIVVVDEPWTVDDGSMTPTLKVRRHVVERRFEALVQGVRGSQVRWLDELRTVRTGS